MSETIQRSYNLVAEEYARHFRSELNHKPFDRKMLGWLTEKVGSLDVICDMGCGPGQIARYLSDRGARTCGVDSSPAMVQQARSLNPDISFEQGNMLSLNNIADNSYGGIAAFYSIVHIPPEKIVQAFRELKRVLRPQGVLLLTFHIGQETRHFDQWWEKSVSLDFHFFETEAMKRSLMSVEFDLQEVIERDPYPDVEVQTRRAYLFANKP